TWAANDVDIQLYIDWIALGIDPSKASIIAPEIVGLQKAANLSADAKIRVDKNKGILLVIKQIN
ncbi:MAG TPA: DUF6067 family protein, partial [Pyrinomonadaceae bacterium]|nr:DUF6067 family protein [Pyrinomonadaceae bacterium]